jgi:hypothetical protein
LRPRERGSSQRDDRAGKREVGAKFSELTAVTMRPYSGFAGLAVAVDGAGGWAEEESTG